VLVVVHLHRVLAPSQRIIGVNLPDAAIVPFIQHDLAVHPDARTIVYRQIEAIGRRVEVLLA
jgi:hypothetical protein